MTEPFATSPATARFRLPYLYAAQSQKEFFINEAYSLIDALLHPVVEGLSDIPPAEPKEGECWIVDTEPTAAWAQHAGQIACFQAGSWLFANAAEGMSVFDRSSATDLKFTGEWTYPPQIQLGESGAVVDAEARQAITALISALVTQGILRAA